MQLANEASTCGEDHKSLLLCSVWKPGERSNMVTRKIGMVLLEASQRALHSFLSGVKLYM